MSALKILRAGDFPGLSTAFGACERDMEAGQPFICALYGQHRGTTKGGVKYRLYTMKFGKLLKVICPHLQLRNLTSSTLCAPIYRQLSQNQFTSRLHPNFTSHTFDRRSKMASQHPPHTINPLQVHCVRLLLEAHMRLTLNTDI